MARRSPCPLPKTHPRISEPTKVYRVEHEDGGTSVVVSGTWVVAGLSEENTTVDTTWSVSMGDGDACSIEESSTDDTVAGGSIEENTADDTTEAVSMVERVASDNVNTTEVDVDVVYGSVRLPMSDERVASVIVNTTEVDGELMF